MAGTRLQAIVRGRRAMRAGRWVFLVSFALATAGAADLFSVWWMTRGVPTSWEDQSLLLGLGAVLLLLALLLALVAAVALRAGTRLAHASPEFFLDAGEEERVIEEIRRFEARSSGEIVVHLCGRAHVDDIMGVAARTFEHLGLSQTRERNAVLFFVAVDSHLFAVLGDSGIDERVGPGFWDEVVGRVQRHFAAGAFGDGLVAGIDLAGTALAAHFPPRPDDVNELPDSISRT